MQLHTLHKNIYSLYTYGRTQEFLGVYRQFYQERVQKWDLLRQEGVCEGTCQKIVGISRATYYRYQKILKNLEKGVLPPSKRPKRLNKPQWGEAHKQLVLKLRRQNPTYGKEKLAIILKRDHGQTLSESTVGRILKHLKEKGLINASSSALRLKRKRSFHKHAKAWSFKAYQAMALGERVQVDHMTVSKNGKTIKHFQAWERKSSFLFATANSNASSRTAKRFLRDLVKAAPFPILSLQVDGGSEFRGAFEEACAELAIPLFVLPPRKPQYNGGVERANRTFREEFYDRRDLYDNSVRGIQAALTKALHKYNTYRPHRTLKGLTPMQYIHSYLSQTTSHPI